MLYKRLRGKNKMTEISDKVDHEGNQAFANIIAIFFRRRILTPRKRLSKMQEKLVVRL